ncbi:MAG: sensor domain-containing protein [Anaerolineales bacterium]|nr:sensor domain-containing protein [Anaerolineales bacterium]
MEHPNPGLSQFFRVMVSKQPYLNLLYLFSSFPLGLFYFVFLVSGIALGVSLSIIWVGIPLLLVMAAGWLMLAKFERFLAVHILNEDIPEFNHSANTDTNLWNRFREHFANTVTWKSLLYLILKFPLGLATFVILVTLVALTLAFLSLPFTYNTMEISFGPWLPLWQMDSVVDALPCVLIGLLLWPVTLNVVNGLACIHARLARVMLSKNQVEIPFSLRA